MAQGGGRSSRKRRSRRRAGKRQGDRRFASAGRRHDFENPEAERRTGERGRSDRPGRGWGCRECCDQTGRCTTGRSARSVRRKAPRTNGHWFGPLLGLRRHGEGCRPPPCGRDGHARGRENSRAKQSFARCSSGYRPWRPAVEGRRSAIRRGQGPDRRNEQRRSGGAARSGRAQTPAAANAAPANQSPTGEAKSHIAAAHRCRLRPRLRLPLRAPRRQPNAPKSRCPRRRNMPAKKSSSS